MPDDTKKRGKADRIRVSRQDHELQRLKDKFDISGQAAGAAQRVAGPMRKDVEKYIRDKKKRGDY